jgi:predicted MFS family arabinose efflux permease
LGAPLAGVLVALTGAPSVLLLDAATFLVSAALMAALVPNLNGRVERGRSYLRELVSGFGHLRRDRLIGAIVVMVMVTNALDTASMAVLFPVYAKDVLHSSVALGLIGAGFGIGGAVGTALYSWLGHRLPNWATYTFAFLLVGSPRYFVMAAEPGLPLILIVLLAAGVLGGAINPILSVVEYRRLPEDMRAKVLGVMTGGVLAVAPLGAVLGGVAVAALGLTATLLLVGGCYLATTLCPLVFRTWRDMDSDGP